MNRNRPAISQVGLLVGWVLPLAIATVLVAWSGPGIAGARQLATLKLSACINGVGSAAPSEVIASCTAAISTGELSAANRVRAFNDRGIAYKDENEKEHALEDFSAALKVNPNYAEALNNRAAVYMVKGDYDLAIADYDRAIELVPDYFTAIEDRGSAYEYKGDYAKAMADYSNALRVMPQSPLLFQARGILNYIAGDYQSALSDELNAVNYGPSDKYSAIWLYLARNRYGKNSAKEARDELMTNTASADLTDWPGPVIEVYLGKLKPEQFIASNTKAGQPTEDRACEANFYLGEHFVLSGDKQGAERSFRGAVASCTKSNIELAAAERELTQISQ